MGNAPTAAIPSQSNQRATLLIGAAATVVLLALLASVVWLSQRAGGDEEPPALPPFEPPAVARVPGFEVRSVTGAEALLVADQAPGQSTDITRTIDLTGGIDIEWLEPTRPAAIAAGDIVTAIGIYNEVRNFTVHFIVIQPADAPLDDDGIARSPLGFAGHELVKGKDRPILSGRVAEVTDGRVRLDVGGEMVWLDLLDSARVFTLMSRDASAVVPGGRVALIEDDGRLSLLAAAPGVGN